MAETVHEGGIKVLLRGGQGLGGAFVGWYIGFKVNEGIVAYYGENAGDAAFFFWGPKLPSWDVPSKAAPINLWDIKPPGVDWAPKLGNSCMATPG
jgi:hypothetical protein